MECADEKKKAAWIYGGGEERAVGSLAARGVIEGHRASLC